MPDKRHQVRSKGQSGPPSAIRFQFTDDGFDNGLGSTGSYTRIKKPAPIPLGTDAGIS
jgi:hypothetical protein